MKPNKKYGASTGHAASPETIVIKRKVLTKTPKAKTPRFVAKVGKSVISKNKATPAPKTPKTVRTNSISKNSKVNCFGEIHGCPLAFAQVLRLSQLYHYNHFWVYKRIMIL